MKVDASKKRLNVGHHLFRVARFDQAIFIIRNTCSHERNEAIFLEKGKNSYQRGLATRRPHAKLSLRKMAPQCSQPVRALKWSCHWALLIQALPLRHQRTNTLPRIDDFQPRSWHGIRPCLGCFFSPAIGRLSGDEFRKAARSAAGGLILV